MKEQYYSNSSIDQQAQDLLKEIRPFCIKRPNIQIIPSKAALLVIDLQNYFVDEASHAHVPSVNAIIPRIVKLQKHCLQNGIKVIHTRHGNTKEDASMMAKWWGGRLLDPASSESEIISEISNLKAVIIPKTQYDAFYNSSLDDVLKDSGIEQLIIAGVMTHLCCETTARVAFTRGYEVFFSIDGTATYNRKFHSSALVNLAHGFAVPMLIDEMISSL
jgi:bifunctional isochorismate lyase / aryl carrier protein